MHILTLTDLIRDTEEAHMRASDSGSLLRAALLSDATASMRAARCALTFDRPAIARSYVQDARNIIRTALAIAG